MLEGLALEGNSSESRVHKAMKYILLNEIAKHNLFIKEKTTEKYFGNRVADIYFRMRNGSKIAVEVQNSAISVNEIKNRMDDYNKNGIHVLWILNGEGKCCFSPKQPIDQTRAKMSPAEIFLHRIYGGRVYYLKLKEKKKEISFFQVYGLHFSKPLDKKYRGMFKTQHGNFFIRDTHFMRITDLKLLLTDFSRYKIARFYDKGFRNRCELELNSYIQESQFAEINKRALRKIIKQYNRKFGAYIIFLSLLRLQESKKCKINDTILSKIRKKVE
jgi:hypothetical protein